MKKRYILGGIAAAVILLALVAGKGGKNPSPAPSQTAVQRDAASQQTATEAPVAVTARELSDAFQKNEARAKLAYDDKDLKITGKVKDINLDFTDEPIIVLSGSGDAYGMGVSAGGKITDVRLSGLPKEDAAKINKGETITAVCHGVATFIGSAQLSNCQPV